MITRVGTEDARRTTTVTYLVSALILKHYCSWCRGDGGGGEGGEWVGRKMAKVKTFEEAHPAVDPTLQYGCVVDGGCDEPRNCVSCGDTVVTPKTDSRAQVRQARG